MSKYLERREAYWTCETSEGAALYYFAPMERRAPPYRTQREVRAILDIADDGTLAGVELIDDAPPPPPWHHPMALKSLIDRLRAGQRLCASIGLEDASIYKEAADEIVRLHKFIEDSLGTVALVDAGIVAPFEDNS